MKKYISALLAAVLLLLSACAAQPAAEPEPQPATQELAAAPTLTCYCLDVGKADCIVLQTADHLVVIDTGEADTAKDVTQFLASLPHDTVDALILTHFDKDHIGGAKRLLKKETVQQIIVPDYFKQSATMDELEAAMDKHQITPTYATQTMELTLDGVVFTIYPTAKAYQGTDESNEFSLAITVRDGDNTLLFAGDAVGERLDEVVAQLPEPKQMDFVKMPHHGVYDAGTSRFLQAIAPKSAVITCSKADPADGRVLDSLSQQSVDTYLTTDGMVTVTGDGKTLKISQ